jgi:enamine deaminase RidA (YjgF/YER057c/UK114 family)
MSGHGPARSQTRLLSPTEGMQMSVTYVRRPAGLGEPLGRYSHVSVAQGRQVNVAGQVGVLETGELAGDGSFEAQVRQAFANLATALASVGATTRDLAKTTTFIVGGEHLDTFMRVRGEVFAELFPTGEYPPNTLLFVQRLVETRLLVEVEGIAVLNATEETDV